MEPEVNLGRRDQCYTVFGLAISPKYAPCLGPGRILTREKRPTGVVEGPGVFLGVEKQAIKAQGHLPFRRAPERPVTRSFSIFHLSFGG